MPEAAKCFLNLINVKPMMAKRNSFIYGVFVLVLFMAGDAKAQLSIIDSIYTKFFTEKVVVGSDTITMVTDTILDGDKVDLTLSNAVDAGPNLNTFQLATGLNTNLAKGTSAVISYAGALPKDTARLNPLRLVDGDVLLSSYLVFPGYNNGGAPGTYIIFDLKAVRSVNKIRMCALPADKRILSYTIYGGLDTLSMEKIYIENKDTLYNATNRYTEITFPVVNVRYLKYRVDEIQSNDLLMTDFQVFGPGYLPEGTLYSKVKVLPKNVNFSTVNYQGVVPNLTNVFVSLRTGKGPVIDTTWSAWSDEVSGKNSLFDVAEPRRYIQYRVRLTTDTVNTPVLSKIIINYDNDLIVTDTKCSISPQEATVLKEQDFTLRTVLSFNPTDFGIDTLRFLTPSPVILKGVFINNNPVKYKASVLFKEVTLVFDSTLKTSGNLDIVMRTTPYVDARPHTMKLSSKKVANNPQKVDTDTKNGIEGWSIILIGVPDKLLNEVRLTKNPFTPNGDGKNDITEIEFYLGNIAEPRGIIGTEIRNLKVKILDLTGRSIRTLFDAPTNATAFKGEGNPLVWDGKDDGGKRVRPGLYLIQIAIDADKGTEQVTKTVVVAY